MGRRKKTESPAVDVVNPEPTETALVSDAPTVPPEAPVEEFIPPSLKESERLRLKLSECEAQRYALEANLRLLQRENLLRKLDPEGQLAKLEGEARSAIEKSQTAKRQYALVVQSVEARLNLKMSDYSFDDETGALIPH